jgi:hypothetical protein
VLHSHADTGIRLCLRRRRTREGTAQRSSSRM